MLCILNGKRRQLHPVARVTGGDRPENDQPKPFPRPALIQALGKHCRQWWCRQTETVGRRGKQLD
eukprot:85312-Alexandrium_andersonii.AAC.1